MNNGFLEQVRAFVAIATTRSLTAAAALLGVAQPTISRQLAALEHDLGFVLIQRSTRALTLTSDGENFLSHATLLVEAADAALMVLRPTSAALKGHLKISCSNGFAKHLLIPALSRWQALHPDLHLDLMISDEIEPIVTMGLDVAIRVGQLKNSTLIARRIGQFQRFMVASRGYLAKYGPVCDLEDLKRHHCIAIFGEPRRPWLVKGGAGTISLTVSGPFRVSTVGALRDAVLANLGIAITPAWFWRDEIDKGDVVRVLEDYPVPQHTIYAVSSKRIAPKSREAAFVDFVKDIFAPYSMD